MAFFSKLKERLFRSSSKLDEGLDAIVEDGGEEEALETPVEELLAPDSVVEEPTPEPEPDPAPEPVVVTQPVPTPAPKEATPSKPGLMGRLLGRSKPTVVRRSVGDEMFGPLEELVIQ